jgi:hypothetical protein
VRSIGPSVSSSSRRAMCTTPSGSIPRTVAVEREMVDRTQRQAVHDGGDALRFEVGNDVRGLDERSFAQRADRAAVAAGAHDVELEALLVQTDPRVARRVRADVGSGDQAAGLHVLDRQAGLQDDGTCCGVVSGHEHRRDDEVLAGGEGAEVHQRRLEIQRRAQGAVIGLVDCARAVGVYERRSSLVERIGGTEP